MLTVRWSEEATSDLIEFIDILRVLHARREYP